MTQPKSHNEQEAYQRAEDAAEAIYAKLEGSGVVEDFAERSGINSLGVLTVSSYYSAMQEIEALWPQIKNQTVVEIGAGVGMLALQMAKFAKKVYAIEADPSWTWVFTEYLYAIKPRNLTFIFGNAEEMVGKIHADVAVIYTCSDVAGMKALAAKFAPRIIHGPLVSFNKRHQITGDEIAFVERVAARLGTERFGMRGFTRADVDAAVAAEWAALSNSTDQPPKEGSDQ